MLFLPSLTKYIHFCKIFTSEGSENGVYSTTGLDVKRNIVAKNEIGNIYLKRRWKLLDVARILPDRNDPKLELPPGLGLKEKQIKYKLQCHNNILFTFALEVEDLRLLLSPHEVCYPSHWQHYHSHLQLSPDQYLEQQLSLPAAILSRVLEASWPTSTGLAVVSDRTII